MSGKSLLFLHIHTRTYSFIKLSIRLFHDKCVRQCWPHAYKAMNIGHNSKRPTTPTSQIGVSECSGSLLVHVYVCAGQMCALLRYLHDQKMWAAHCGMPLTTHAITGKYFAPRLYASLFASSILIYKPTIELFFCLACLVSGVANHLRDSVFLT